MLRITRVAKQGAAELKVEGKLLRPWIETLRAEVDSLVATGAEVQLELSALTFVDTAGARQLLDLERQGIRLTGMPEFVRGLLHLQRH